MASRRLAVMVASAIAAASPAAAFTAVPHSPLAFPPARTGVAMAGGTAAGAPYADNFDEVTRFRQAPGAAKVREAAGRRQ